MSTDITAAFAAIQARAIAQITTLPLHWQDEPITLPDVPAAFVYFELVTERGAFLEVGGGRGSNLHRHSGELIGYVFVPRGWGLSEGLTRAETVAAAFRSYRGGGITCEGASVHPAGEGEGLVPPGVASVANNYTCVMAVIPLHFDQTG